MFVPWHAESCVDLQVLLVGCTIQHLACGTAFPSAPQVLLFLQDMLKATPESLGDARKETPEELAERHERVVAASLLALSSLLDLLVSKEQHVSPTG